MSFDLTGYKTLSKYLSLSHSVRPLRVAYIVEASEDSHPILDAIFADSYKRWGGRGTLIVPFENGTINQIYFQWLEKYDPDIIYTYVDLNEECLKKINSITMPLSLLRHKSKDRAGNPATLTPKHGAEAVQSLSMIPYILRQQEKDKPIVVCKHFDWSDDRFVMDNLGAENCNSHSDLYNPLSIIPENTNPRNVHYGLKVNTIDEMLHKMTEDRTIVSSSQLSLIDSPSLSFEQSIEQGINLIIGDSFQDRLTFWNIALFIERSSFLRFPAFIVSKSKFTQIDFVRALVNFFKSRYHQFGGNYQFANIRVSSSSLSKEEIDVCISNAKEWVNTIHIMADKKIDCLTFTLNSRELYKSQLRSERFNEIPYSFIPLEPEHFQYIPFHMQKLKSGKYAADLGMERYVNNSRVINRPHFWNLPRRFDILPLFIEKYSRVTKHGSISFAYSCITHDFSSDKLEVSVTFPEDSSFFGRIFCAEKFMPEKDLRVEKVMRPFSDLKTSEKGRALQAIIHLFDGLNPAFNFINNLFWREYVQTAISYKMDVNHNSQPIYKIGDKTVDVGLEDLKRIRRKILNKFIKAGNRQDFQGKKAGSDVMNNMQRALKELVARTVIYQGYKWNCRKCANINWVSVNDKIQLFNKCNVCDNKEQIDVEPLSWDYRLNQRVVDALYKEAVICELWTLGYLLDSSRKSMYYIHQSDLFKGLYDKESKYELDIICVVDGKFIIGESKYFSYSFKDEDIDKLIHLANELKPDTVILSFLEKHGDEMDRHKEKIEAHGFNVSILSPVSTGFHLPSPWSSF